MQTTLQASLNEGEKVLGNLCINICERLYKCVDSDLDDLCRDFSSFERYNPSDQKCRDIRNLVLALIRQKYVKVEYKLRGHENFLDIAGLRLTRKGISLLRRERPEVCMHQDEPRRISEGQIKRMGDYIEFRSRGYTQKQTIEKIQKSQVRA